MASTDQISKVKDAEATDEHVQEDVEPAQVSEPIQISEPVASGNDGQNATEKPTETVVEAEVTATEQPSQLVSTTDSGKADTAEVKELEHQGTQPAVEEVESEVVEHVESQGISAIPTPDEIAASPSVENANGHHAKKGTEESGMLSNAV